MKLQFVKEREFNIEIKNENSEKKFTFCQTGFRSASGVENGKNFPIKSVYKYTTKGYYTVSYLILDKSLTFKPDLYNTKSNINNPTETDIDLADYSPTIISKDDIICKSTEDVI